MHIDTPPLIYGTAWKKEHTKELVIQAVKTGFIGIDTACQPKHYHEEGVGEAIEALAKDGFRREDLFLQTKFTPLSGQDPLNIPYDKKAKLSTQVAQSFDISKTNLNTNYIDSLILHSPLSPFEDFEAVWKAMEEIAQRGEAKQLGISNIYNLQTLQRLYDMANIKPSVVQNRFYQDSGYDKEIRSFCKINNIIYQSFWTLTANPHILQSKELLGLSKKYNKNVIQLFFAYLHQIGITPLTGTTDLEHMQSDLQSFDITLEDSEISNLDSLFE
ncbi:aldo/keto reductase [Candidatus Sulfurimonas marisnigri]|uniref:Aldo/keto reductase n=1 Tax=Candidatus Sulfurimonas marisnigri TaxID=2740405 RepID=A0A7S7LY84_9BACT|nr:aldo/keto reductase [Candidatus Sulfurimonas marisnigri]QOY53601.1 aldo/keto reductase [Candidatus Sulfurimonas marisnigri]